MKTRRILSALLAALMMLSVFTAGLTVNAASPFIDVDGHWAADAIDYVVEAGLMNGVEDGSRFAPDMSLTRGMVVTVLYRNNGSPDVAFKGVFLDVEENKYYAAAAEWAYNNEIVTGTGTDEWGEPYFSPDSNITRQELATMFSRYAAFKHVNTAKNTDDISTYPDSASVASWATDHLKWAVGVGLITGKTNGGDATLSPTDKAMRAEFATIIQRYNTKAPDFDYLLYYSEPMPISTYTEPDYPLVNDADIYVAVDGNDSNPGTFEEPLATFAAAKAKVRELKKTKTDGIKVAFMEGTYEAPEGLAFTAEDSGTETCPITYCAYGDGEVKFNGGAVLPHENFTSLSASEKEMFNDEFEDSIKKLDITKFGVDGSQLTNNTDIFSGLTRLDIARWPNKLASGNDDFTNHYLSVSEDKTYINLMTPIVNRLNAYHNIDDMYMFGYYRYDWSASDGKVIKYEPDTGKIYPTVNGYGIFNNPEGDPSCKCPYFYFYNIPDELDRADEYYIDKNTGILYVMNPKDDLVICLTGDMMTLNDTNYVSFVGLSFCYGTGSCMLANNVNNITVDRCKFNNIREKGITIQGNNNIITSCEFYDVGARNVEMNCGDRATLTPGNCVIENCLFDRFGSVTKTGQPAIYVQGCGIRIAHNEISNSSNIGIMYSEYIWASNYITIEYNYLHNVVTQTSDSGAIYGGRNPAGHGTVIRYNLITNVGNHSEGHEALGIYLDDQMSGQEIYGNIFYNMANHSVFVNGGRENKIHDNIMIATTDYTKKEILIGQRGYDSAIESTENFTKPLGDTEPIMIMELVPFRNELWTSRFPDLAKVVYDVNNMAPYVDDAYCVLNPSFNEVYDNHIMATEKRIANGGLEEFAERAVTYGSIEASAVYDLGENPFFVNPTLGDYSIDPEKSDIDIPYDMIGRY